MILAKEILSSTRRKNKHSGFTMIELIVALTFALIFVTAVLHTISRFGYSALYSKKNDMKFRKLAEYKLRQINILPSLEDNRKFHVIDLNAGKLISNYELMLGFFIENIPTCLFKSSPVDYLSLMEINKGEIEARLWFTGTEASKKAGDIGICTEFGAQLTDNYKGVFIKPIFSEKCDFPLDFQIPGNAFKKIKDSKIIFNGLVPTKKTGMNLRSNDIKTINNWNELSEKEIQFNYQNLLIFQLLGDKIKKLYVYFE